MKYIGIDLGSTYTKAALFGEEGIITSLSVHSPEPVLSGIRHETDADEYASQVISLLEELRCPDVRGILISTQMHGYILSDRRFRPLSRYVSWQDRAAERWLSAFRDDYGADAVAKSGVPWKTNLALSALLARRCEGEMPPENALFNTLGGYMIGRLTGEHVCHMTNAAPSGMADVRAGSWNTDLITGTGMDCLIFPKTVTGLEPCGSWHGIPVYPDIGDQQMCAAGAELTRDKTLHISIGTAGLIGMLTEEWGTGAYENRPWITPGVYLRTVSGLPGGRHLTLFARNIAAMARQLTGQEVSTEQALAYLSVCGGVPVPGADALWQASAGDEHTFVQNLYESFAAAYEIAAKRFGLPVEELSFSGGCAAKNGALRQRVVSHFARPAVQGDHDVWRGMRKIAYSV